MSTVARCVTTTQGSEEPVECAYGDLNPVIISKERLDDFSVWTKRLQPVPDRPLNERFHHLQRH